MKFAQWILTAAVGCGMIVPLTAQVARSANYQAASRTASYLGIGVVEVNQQRAQQLRMPVDHGMEITLLAQGGPAARGGIERGDVVTSYNGEPVRTLPQFLKLVQDTEVGEKVTMELFRDGSMRMAEVTMGAQPVQEAQDPDLVEAARQARDVMRNLMTWRSPMLGVEAESLEGQFAEFFGVKQGVLVRSVVDGSAAERAGLKAGDVIQEVDGTAVITPNEVTSRLRAMTGNSVTLNIVRNRTSKSVEVKF